jgi:stage II sporulation protein E
MEGKMKGSKKRIIIINTIGFIVARAVFLGMNPLALGYFTAAYMAGAGGRLVFASVFLGIVTAMPLTQGLNYFLVMSVTVIIMEVPAIKKLQPVPAALYGMPAIVFLVIAILQTVTGQEIGSRGLMVLLETVIVYVSARIWKSPIGFLMEVSKGYRMNNEQMVSMAALAAVVIYAMPEIGGGKIAPVETVVYFMVLYFTYQYGVGQGAIIGAVCGLALSLRGGAVEFTMEDISILTMMGIIPGGFREMGRLVTAAVYLTLAGTMGRFGNNMELPACRIGALVSAVVVFLLLPRSLLYRLEEADAQGHQKLLAEKNLRKIARTRLNIFSDAFLKLSGTLDTITEKQEKIKQREMDHIFEEISEKLCKNCNHCSVCWERNFEETYRITCALFKIAEKNGRIQKEDVPVSFLKECICADEFMLQTNRGFEIAKLNRIWNNRIAESREVMAQQLKDVSSVIQNITGDIDTIAQASHCEEERVIARLKAEHIRTKEITIFERGDKRKEIYLTAACRYRGCVTAREAAAAIGDAMGLRLRVSGASKTVISKEYDHFIFVEDPKFKVLSGVARTMKENVSGDNFSVLTMETGEVMLALSDGMGTGKDAGEESETVMSLLEQMIEAGFKTETAIRLINSNLVLKSDRQTFSTIDLSIINLFTGMCEFIKIGAASAFIRRDNWVETISSTTLPVGMFGNVDYDTVTKKLYEGDIVIMVTDGILDSIPTDDKETFMEQLLMEIKSSNPQEIANQILDNALKQSNYVPGDDMTVIAVGLWPK